MDWLIDKVRQLEADMAALKEQLARTAPYEAQAAPADYPPALEPAPAQTEAARSGDEGDDQ